MTIAYDMVTVLTIAAVGLIAAADLVPARAVLANSAAVGVTRSWLRPLGVLKGAGALGLLVGLAGVPLVGTAAAAGLVAFFVGAVVTHLQAGDRSATLGFPSAYLALAVTTLALGLSA